MFESENDFKNIVEQLNIDTQPNDNHRENVRRQMLSAFNQSRQHRISWPTITKLAAAAAIIITATLAITFLQQSATPAYAIEQTIEANRGMRYLHTKYFDSSHDDVGKECWLEFDETGEPKNVRINWSEWMARGEIVVWNPDRTQTWRPKENRLIAFNDQIYTSRIHNMTEKDDQRLMVEGLYDRQAKGEVEIEIDQSANKSEPVIVTSTNLKTKGRLVLFVDQSTKLVTSMEWYQLKEGQYEYQGVMEYHDYNVPIDARMFTLDDEVPTEAHRIDTRTQDIGLAQGNLTDKEIAVEVVRELLQALIAKDYAKAGQICGGLTANEIQHKWGKLNVVQIVSIGEPGPPSKPSKVFPKMQSVAYTIECEKNGETTQKSWDVTVRPVLGRHDRWMLERFGF
ncbi:MAG: hypothetical protein ACYSU6_05905 [Planctomycetota bacterium]|jgi:hypothetical protein